MVHTKGTPKKTSERAIRKTYFRESLNQKKKWQKRMIITFSVMFLFFFTVGLLFWLRPKKSETEKRTLAAKPTLTWSGLMDGTFFGDYTTWYADTYPLREPMIRGYQLLENLSGLKTGGTIYGGTAQQTGEQVPVSTSSETPAVVTPAPTLAVTPTPEPDGTVHEAPEVAGTVYVTGNQAFDLYYFSGDNATTYASMVNTVSAWTGKNINVYSIIPSNAFGVYLDADVQKGMTGSYVGDAMDYIYSLIDDSVKKVNAFDSLVHHNAEYIYFRTDHHWTALGAYYTYVEFCKTKGIEPHTLDQFEQKDFPGFLGTFYAFSNQNPALGNDPDTVTAYVPMGTNELTYQDRDGESFTAPIVADVSEYSSENKYLTFVAGDQPFETITTPNTSSTESCVIVKDSYGNAFVPFLVDHYKNVYVVDYRYYNGDLTQFCLDHQVSDVILMSNIEAVTADRANLILSRFSDHSNDPEEKPSEEVTAGSSEEPDA